MTAKPEPVFLDHLAFAVDRWDSAWPLFAGELGGRWGGCGYGAGYAPMQLAFDGGRIELVKATGPGFLRAFLERHGPGPQHLTFKVPNVGDAVQRISDTGFRVHARRRVRGRDQAFLDRDECGGIIVQLIDEEPKGELPPAPEEFVSGPASSARLERYSLAVRDLTGVARLYTDGLAGISSAKGRDAHGEWVEILWPESPRLRVVAPSPGTDLDLRLGNRPGMVYEVGFSGHGPRMRRMWLGVTVAVEDLDQAPS